MRPVELSEILELTAYEAVRERVRADVIAAKAARRVPLGKNMSLLFENRETVRYQVQEMLRIERLVKPAEVEHELATYNELVPGFSELSATLLVEFPEEQERDRSLRALLGLENGAIRLVVGKLPPVVAVFDNRQIGTDRISSVHYLRFTLPAPSRAAFRTEGLAGNIRFVVDHPAYRCETVLLPAQVLQLAKDLETD
jgi:hypothetical protein